jgi:hypothetical protein
MTPKDGESREAFLLRVLKARMKWLSSYTGDNDTHRGVLLALTFLDGDLRSAQQRYAKGREA